MPYFDLNTPVELLFCGEFISPEHDWKHLTRNLLEYELMLVTEGTLLIGDSAQEYTVPAGEYLLMSPDEFQHGTQVCKCRFFWLHFRCPAGETLIPTQGTFGGVEVPEIMERLLRTERTAPACLLSRYLASELLLTLNCSAPPAAHATLSERIKEFVFRNRFSDLKVSDIARAFGYHEKYISAAFRREEGVALKSYLIRRRLGEAERLLLETDYTPTEISYFLNFSSPHTFFRFFKTHAGETAGEFRSRRKTRT